MGDDRQDLPDRPRSSPHPDDADGTQRIPPPGAGPGGPGPEAGATARQEPIDRTAPLPPAGQIDQAARPAPWSGRAEVRPRLPADDSGPVDWYAGQDQAERRWWMPILIGVVALLLLGVLGFGVWLILQSGQDDPDPPPLPSTVPSVTGLPSPTTAPSITTAPSTTAPTSAPTDPESTGAPTTAERPSVPPLVGLSREQAVAALDRLGLDYRIRTRESDRPPGTVVATEPGPGEPVPAGGEVTLVIAVPRTTVPTDEPTRTPGTSRPTR